jgi:prevent-host-death family protein
MMIQVNVHQAKSQLSRLLESVERGDDVVIARNGTPVAKLVPYIPPPKRTGFGSMRGEIDMTGFWECEEEIIREMGLDD